MRRKVLPLSRGFREAVLQRRQALSGYQAKGKRFILLFAFIPIILGSAVFEIIGGEFIFVPWDCLAIGFFTAFLSGLVSLKLLKKVFLKNRFDVFAVYLTVLSVFLLINDFWLHIF